jgi:hypothetical protein
MPMDRIPRSFSWTGVAGLLLVSTAVGAVYQAIPNQVAYYAFEEAAGPTAADSSGNGYDATHVGVVVVSSEHAPVPTTGNNRSLLFNPGAGAYVQRGYTAALNITGPFTLAAWIRPTAGYTANGNPNNRGAIIRSWQWMDPPGTINGIGMDRLEDGRILMFNGTPSGYASPTSTGTVPLNVWSHVAAVYDGAFNRIYINGVQNASFAHTTNPGINTTPFRIGNDDWIRYFYGNIDEVRIFNRALDAGEVAVLHGGLPAPANLVAMPGIDRVDLSWNAVAGASSYTVFMSNTSGSGYAQIGTTPGTTFTATGIYYPNTYYFVVVANGIMTSGYSNEASGAPDNNLPRFNDHEEGAKDRNCGCGSADAGASIWTLALAGLFLLGLSARRA